VVCAMIVYQMTQAEFLACSDPPVAGTYLGFFDLYPQATWIQGSETVLAINPDYATAPVAQHPVTFSEQLLLVRENNGWRIVGGYIGTNILIEPEAAGKHLSTELILRCAEHRPPPIRRTLSMAGFGALRRAHETAVRAAVLGDLNVPAKVRADYGL
jgi:hypothetical protein